MTDQTQIDRKLTITLWSLTITIRFVEFGREDGMAAGERNGAIEGRVMGCEKGFELSREVGYYAGCAQLWKTLAQMDPERISEK
jgi:hypothetical protein